MGKIDIIEELKADNPRAASIDVQIYAEALNIWHTALLNVRKNGAICLHPRTGAPIANPYNDVMTRQGALMQRMKFIKSDRVVGLITKTAGEINKALGKGAENGN